MKMKLTEISEDKFDIYLYCYRWVDTSAGELLVPEGIIRPVVSVTITE
jgi:hypothetical protein